VEMEKLLLHWICGMQMWGESTDGNTICEKAKSISDDFRLKSDQSLGSVFDDFASST
jgi:hypothetical protein